MALCLASKEIGETVLVCDLDIPHDLHFDQRENLEWRELPDIRVGALSPSYPLRHLTAVA